MCEKLQITTGRLMEVVEMGNKWDVILKKWTYVHYFLQFKSYDHIANRGRFQLGTDIFCLRAPIKESN